MTCDCGHDSPHFSVRVTRMGARTCCRACRYPTVRSIANPYTGMILEHVHDDHGQSLRVDSIRQLQDAEKRFRFKSLVANERSADFDKPPQSRPTDLFEQMTESGGWLYPEIAEQQIREMRENGEIG